MEASYLEMMRAHVDEGGQLLHRNGLDLLAEVERLTKQLGKAHKALEFIRDQRWNVDGDIDEICDAAERALPDDLRP